MTTPDPLKPKPETLGFEREAERLFIEIHQRYLLQKEEFFIELFAAALEAAFSKGTEEGYRKGLESGLSEAKFIHCCSHAWSDGWNACKEKAVIAAELYCIFGDDCNESDYDCRACKAAKEIRALKPSVSRVAFGSIPEREEKSPNRGEI